MNMSEVVGTKVMVLLHSAKGLAKLGIDETSTYCRVVGFDHIGLWVENPAYEETPIRDESGMLIPQDQREPRRYVAHILLPWANVRSLVAFPGRDREADLESEEVRTIGSYL
jgi:hypothetical protein